VRCTDQRSSGNKKKVTKGGDNIMFTVTIALETFDVVPYLLRFGHYFKRNICQVLSIKKEEKKQI
jgi:hypothetical protein